MGIHPDSGELCRMGTHDRKIPYCLDFTDDGAMNILQAWHVHRQHNAYLAGTYQFRDYAGAVQCAAEFAEALEDGRVFADASTLIPGLFCEFYLKDAVAG